MLDSRTFDSRTFESRTFDSRAFVFAVHANPAHSEFLRASAQLTPPTPQEVNGRNREGSLLPSKKKTFHF